MITVNDELKARLAAKKESYWAGKGKGESRRRAIIVCAVCGSHMGPFRWFGTGKNRRLGHIGCKGADLRKGA